MNDGLTRRGNLDTQTHMVGGGKAMRRKEEKTMMDKPRRGAWNGSFPHGSEKKPIPPTPCS